MGFCGFENVVWALRNLLLLCSCSKVLLCWKRPWIALLKGSQRFFCVQISLKVVLTSVEWIRSSLRMFIFLAWLKFTRSLLLCFLVSVSVNFIDCNWIIEHVCSLSNIHTLMYVYAYTHMLYLLFLSEVMAFFPWGMHPNVVCVVNTRIWTPYCLGWCGGCQLTAMHAASISLFPKKDHSI